MRLGFVVSLAAVAAIYTVPSARASIHFDGCTANTGSNATLVVPTSASVQAEGTTLDAGDEIAVFTTEGICAGAGVWNGENLAITIRGDDVFSPEKNGLFEGEALALRLWDASAATEYEASAPGSIEFASDRPYYTVDPHYRENGIYVLSSVTFAVARPEARTWKSVGVEHETPTPFTLEANYPNPFNPGTMIGYRLEESATVRLSVANVLGQTVRVLVDGYQPAGAYQVRVDMSGMPSGLYLYRLESGSYSTTRTMLLSR